MRVMYNRFVSNMRTQTSMQWPVIKNGGTGFLAAFVAFLIQCSKIKTHNSESRGQEEPATTE